MNTDLETMKFCRKKAQKAQKENSEFHSNPTSRDSFSFRAQHNCGHRSQLSQKRALEEVLLEFSQGVELS